uniref:RNA/RNP complex-1-interacting phosphatase n=1 Tax=Leptobrachium leishanense TaxID=445787 RepID=A0A8C5M114_9ANUR
MLVFSGFLCRFPRGCTLAAIHSAAWRMGKNHVPERWTEYSPVGKRMPGTRFIAFKVPLKQLYDSKLAPKDRFSPLDLVQGIQNQNEELGMIVDLTCTWRYYMPNELPESVCYVKLHTAGQEIPNAGVVKQFKCIVKGFLNDNADNDKLIGVHCTHGLNRTGYLVCRYLIDELGMVPADAIETFNRSRGHCMERRNYLDALMHRETKSLYQPQQSRPPAHHVPTTHVPERTMNAPYMQSSSYHPPHLRPPVRHLPATQVPQMGDRYRQFNQYPPPHSRPPAHSVPTTRVSQMSDPDMQYREANKHYRRYRKNGKRKNVASPEDSAHTHPYNQHSAPSYNQRRPK